MNVAKLVCVGTALMCALAPAARAQLSLTAVPSAFLAAPAQPKFDVVVSGITGPSPWGEQPMLSYVRVTCGGNTWYLTTYSGLSSTPLANSWVSALSHQFADPRGALGAGTHAYVVTVFRTNWWISGSHDEDEHDNPDDPDEVTGSHSVDDWSSNDWEQVAEQTLTITTANLTAPTTTFASFTKTFGDPAFALSASANSGTAPSYAVVSQSPAGIVSLAGGTVTILGAGTVTLRATFPASATYAQGIADATLTIAKAAQTIAFGSAATQAVGAPFNPAATASSGLPLSYSIVSGSATLAPGSPSTVTASAVGSVVVQATQAGTANTDAATASRTFTIVASNQTITFPTITAKIVGDADFNPGASASSGLTVVYSIVSGPATIVSNVVHLAGGTGTVVVQAAQPGNANWNAATPAQQSFNVVQAVTVSSTSSGTNPPAFSVAFNPGVNIQGTPALTVTDVTAGVTVGTFYPGPGATQWGANAYNVNYTANTATWTDPRGLAFNGTHTYEFRIAAWSPTGGSRTYGPATATATVVGGPTGSIAVTPGTGGTANFSIAINNASFGTGITSYTVKDRATTQTWTQTVSALTGSATYTWIDPRLPVPNGPVDFTITAWGSVGGQPYSLSTDASYTSSPLTLTAVPSLVIAPPAQPKFNVVVSDILTYSGNGDSQGISYVRVESGGNTWYLSSYYPIGTWAAPNYSARTFNQQFADPRGVLGAGIHTYTVTLFRSVYWVSGSHDEDEHNNPDDPDEVTGSHSVDDWSEDPWSQVAQKTITINIATPTAQTIAFANPGPRLIGVGFDPGATASSSLPVTYSVVSGFATVSGSLVTPTAVGAVVLRAIQAGGLHSGSGTTFAAASVDQSFAAVTLPAPAITFANLARTYGDAPFALASSSNSGSSPSYAIVSQSPAGAISLAGSTVTILTGGTATLRVTYPATANYAHGTADATLTVAKQNQTITFGSLPTRPFGVAPFTVSASASSGLPVSFTVASGSATVSGNSVTLTNFDSVTLTASQAGNAYYNAATNVSQSFAVTPPVPVIVSNTAVTGSFGAPLNYALVASNSPTAYTMTGSLPAGLTFIAATGVLSGTPTQTGVFSLPVSATNAGGTATATLTLTITAATPPTITSQPASQTVTVGSTTTFAVGASGTAPLTYQWRKDNVPIGGAQSATLTLPNVQATNNGSYSVVVTNGGGSATSLSAALTVQPAPTNGFSTLAGLTGNAGWVDATGTAARFSGLSRMAVDIAGNAYVADRWNGTVRKITPYGVVTSLTPAGLLNGPAAVAVDSAGTVYVVESTNCTVRKITTAGVVTILAGSPGVTGTANGTGSAARFYWPQGIAVDAAGSVYVADTQNGAIRKITPAGVVSTFAGVAGSVGWVDGTGSAARFVNPEAIAADASGNLYVLDPPHQVVRKITPGGTVTSVAGQPGTAGSADGTGTGARFNQPRGLSCDAAGNVYIADGGNHTIRKMTPAGVVTTLGGLAGATGSADGLGSAVRFNNPVGIAALANGNLYVADSNNHTIRFGLFNAGPTAPWINSLGNVSAVIGAPFTYVITALNLPTNYSLAGSIPPGLSINPTTGVISGTPTQTGPFSATIIASNAVAAYYASLNFTVGVPVAPAFTSQPQSQCISVGAAVTFGAAASGNPTPSFQWRKDGTNITDAPSASYSITSAGASHAGVYSVAASNMSGTTTSVSAVLLVITTQPELQNVPAGGTATFSVAVANPGAIYQWQRMAAGDSTFVNLVNTSTYAGVSTAALQIFNVNEPMTGDQFRCIITVGGFSGTSAAATLIDAVKSHHDYAVVGVPWAPEIETDSGGPGALQWVVLGPTAWGGTSPGTLLPGGAVASTWTPAAGDIGTRSFYVRQLNADNSETAGIGPYRVTVLPAGAVARPAIARQPASQLVNVGQDATFEVINYSAQARTSYRWERKPNGGSEFSLIPVPDAAPYTGASTFRLIVRNTTLLMSGDQYRCVITNATGATTTAAAVLNVSASGPTLSLETTVLTPDGQPVPTDPTTGTAKARIGDVLVVRTKAGSTGGTLTTHRIHVKRPNVPAFSGSTTDWSDGDDWAGGAPGTPWKKFKAAASSANIVDSNRPPFAYGPADGINQDTPEIRVMTMVLDAVSYAGNHWQVEVGVEASTPPTTRQKLSSVVPVENLKLPGPSGSVAIAPPANTYNKLVGAHFNAGQDHLAQSSLGIEGLWHNPPTGSTWEPFWASYPVTPLVHDPAQGSKQITTISNAIYNTVADQGRGIVADPVGDRMRARDMAYQLIDTGIDFVALDHTNVLFDIPTSYSALDPVVQAAENLKAGFLAAAGEPVGNPLARPRPRVKMTMTLGMTTQWYIRPTNQDALTGDYAGYVPMSTGNPGLEVRNQPDSDPTPSTAAARWIDSKFIPRFNDRVQYIYDNFARDSDIWQYVSDGDDTTSKPLLLLYTGTNGPAFGRYEQDAGGNFLAGSGENRRISTNGKINEYYLNKLRIDVPAGSGTVSKRIDQVFTIRYVGAFLREAVPGNSISPATPTYFIGDSIDTGHWTYNEYSRATATRAQVRNQFGAVVENGYDSLYIPSKSGFPSADAPNPADQIAATPHRLDRYGRSVVALAVPCVDPGDPTDAENSGDLYKNGQFFDALNDAVEKNPRILMFGVWSEVGSGSDEPLPQSCQTIMPNNKFGDLYARKAKEIVTRFKATPVLAPAITTQPVAQTAAIGGAFQFGVVATGTKPLRYQWKRNGDPIPGATHAYYSGSNAQPGDMGTYTVVVSNSVNTVPSNPVTLTQLISPTFTSADSANVTAGQIATFRPTTSGFPLPTLGISSSLSWVSLSAGVLTFSPAGVAPGAYWFSLTASNGVGANATQTFTVNVQAGNSPPAIVTQPAATQTVAEGQPVSFSVVATGNPPPAYAWRKLGDATVLGTNATLTLVGVTTTSAGSYAVTISNGQGSPVTSNSASLTINPAQSAPIITASPIPQTVTVGGTATFTVGATGNPTPSYEWRKVIGAGASASAVVGTQPTFTVSNVALSHAGSYEVKVTNVQGSVTSASVALIVNAPPVIVAASVTVNAPSSTRDAPVTQMVTKGAAVTLSVTATGTPAPNYQWRKDGINIGGAVNAILTLSGFQASAAGEYDVVVSNSVGSQSSAKMILTLADAWLINVSARGKLDAGAGKFYVGVTVSGTGEKRLLVRGIGPTLARFGVSGVLPDPFLELKNSAGLLLASNDDWVATTELAAESSKVGAFALTDESKDAALIFSLPAASGSTAQIFGSPNSAVTTGIVMVEAYDLELPAVRPPAYFSNVAVRNFVGATSDEVLIVGFTVKGNSPKRFLIRAVGPSLAQFGVEGMLPDPLLELFRGNALVGTNDDWGTAASSPGSAALAAADDFSGSNGFSAFPLSSATSKDAAMIVELQPGGYTAQVQRSGNSGAAGITGIALLEIYEMP